MSAPPTAPPPPRRALKLVLSLGLTAGLLALLWVVTDVSQTDLAVRSWRPGFLLVALVAYLGVNLVRALRFRAIHRELVDTDFGRFVEVTLIHSGLNQILPFRTGEVSYVVLMRRLAGATLGRSALVLLVARLFDLMAVFLFCLAFAPLLSSELHVARGTVVAISAGVVAACLLAILVLRPGLRLLYAVLRRLHARGVGNALARRLQPRVERLVAEAAMFRDPSHFFAVFALSLAMWTGLYVTFFGLLNGFGFAIDLPATVLGSVGAIMTSVLPVNGVLNFGTAEAGWTLGLALVGFAKEDAFAAGLWAHLGILGLSAGLMVAGYLAVVLRRR